MFGMLMTLFSTTNITSYRLPSSSPKATINGSSNLTESIDSPTSNSNPIIMKKQYIITKNIKTNVTDQKSDKQNTFFFASGYCNYSSYL